MAEHRLRAGLRAIAIAVVVAVASFTGAASPATAKPKVGDPTSWQTELCRRMDSFLREAEGGMRLLDDPDTSAPAEQQRDDLVAGIALVGTAAYRYLYLDRALGVLPVTKPAAITDPLLRGFAATTQKLKDAIQKAKSLPLPLDRSSAEFAAVDTDVHASVRAFGDAMARVYGHTGNHRFDRAIVANKECKFLAGFASSATTS